MRQIIKPISGIIILLISFTIDSFSQPVSQTFNASGTYVIPSGYSAEVTIEVIGGGGGGGAFNTRSGGGGDGVVIVTVNTVLPVSWVDFSLHTVDGDVELYWATATEVNNMGFDVELSHDGERFLPIAFVPGMGTTDEISEYQYKHTDVFTPSINKVYYRLRQVDYDGNYEYSTIVVSRSEAHNNDLLIYPNPSKGQFTIDVKSNDYPPHVVIYTMGGRTILEDHRLNEGLNEIALAAEPGVYLIHIIRETGVSVQRVILE